MDEAVNEKERLATGCKRRRKDELDVRAASMKERKEGEKEEMASH